MDISLLQASSIIYTLYIHRINIAYALYIHIYVWLWPSLQMHLQSHIDMMLYILRTHMELHVRHRYPILLPSNAEKEHTQKHSEETMHACAPIIQVGCKKVRALTVALIICACKNSCGHTDGCLLHAMCEAQEQGCTSSRALKEGARGQGLLHEDKSAHGRTPRTRIRVHKNKGALNSASKLLDIHAPPHTALHHLSVRCGLWTCK